MAGIQTGQQSGWWQHLVGLLVVCQFVYPAVCLYGWMYVWLPGWQASWLTGWSTSCPSGLLFVYLFIYFFKGAAWLKYL